MGWMRRLGSVALASSLMLATALGIAPAAFAGTWTSFPIAGVVKCKDGSAVSGVWVDSAMGGSAFASLMKFPDQSAAKFQLMLTFYSDGSTRASNVNLKVGCGYKPGTTDQWLTTSVTTRPVTVHAQGTSAAPDPVWLNVDCTPGNLQCAWPNVPPGWDSKPRTLDNPFPGGWCTTGAAARWRDLLDVWPNWVGDGGAWGQAAANAGYTVESDGPRLGSFVSIPYGSPAPPYSNSSAGHIVQVRDITVSGSTILMKVYEMHGGSDALWVYHWDSQKQWMPRMLAIVPPYIPEGDTNADGRTNILDFSYLQAKYNTTDWRADFNDDGMVNLVDFSALAAWFQS